MNKKTDPQLLIFAKSMRHSSTDVEQLMWQILRGKQFMNLKFRRQYMILSLELRMVLMSVLC